MDLICTWEQFQNTTDWRLNALQVTEFTPTKPKGTSCVWWGYHFLDFVTGWLFRDLSFHLLKSKLILWDMNQVRYPFCDQLFSDQYIRHWPWHWPRRYGVNSDVIKIPGHVKILQAIPGSRRAFWVDIPLHNQWN